MHLARLIDSRLAFFFFVHLVYYVQGLARVLVLVSDQQTAVHIVALIGVGVVIDLLSGRIFIVVVRFIREEGIFRGFLWTQRPFQLLLLKVYCLAQYVDHLDSLLSIVCPLPLLATIISVCRLVHAALRLHGFCALIRSLLVG